jgi:hypothetical protein
MNCFFILPPYNAPFMTDTLQPARSADSQHENLGEATKVQT